MLKNTSVQFILEPPLVFVAKYFAAIAWVRGIDFDFFFAYLDKDVILIRCKIALNDESQLSGETSIKIALYILVYLLLRVMWWLSRPKIQCW